MTSVERFVDVYLCDTGGMTYHYSEVVLENTAIIDKSIQNRKNLLWCKYKQTKINKYEPCSPHHCLISY